MARSGELSQYFMGRCQAAESLVRYQDISSQVRNVNGDQPLH